MIAVKLRGKAEFAVQRAAIRRPAQTTLYVTAILPRVAFE